MSEFEHRLSEARREERQRCADLCLYGDIAEVSIPEDLIAACDDDVEAWTRVHCAVAIRNQGAEDEAPIKEGFRYWECCVKHSGWREWDS